MVLFTEAAYFVHEDDLELDVCVSLDGATEVPVSVMLALQQNEQLSPNMMATCEIMRSIPQPTIYVSLLYSWI